MRRIGMVEALIGLLVLALVFGLGLWVGSDYYHAKQYLAQLQALAAQLG